MENKNIKHYLKITTISSVILLFFYIECRKAAVQTCLILLSEGFQLIKTCLSGTVHHFLNTRISVTLTIPILIPTYYASRVEFRLILVIFCCCIPPLSIPGHFCPKKGRHKKDGEKQAVLYNDVVNP